jgi:hypothetical protein
MSAPERSYGILPTADQRALAGDNVRTNAPAIEQFTQTIQQTTAQRLREQTQQFRLENGVPPKGKEEETPMDVVPYEKMQRGGLVIEEEL